MNEINWAFIDGPKTFAPNLYERFSGLFKEGKNLLNRIRKGSNSKF